MSLNAATASTPYGCVVFAPRDDGVKYPPPDPPPQLSPPSPDAILSISPVAMALTYRAPDPLSAG